MVIFLVPKYCFCVRALVRNGDIRQKLTPLAMNKKECVLLAAQAGYTAQAGSIYCFCTAEENIIQFNDAVSLKKQAGSHSRHRSSGFLTAHSCQPAGGTHARVRVGYALIWDGSWATQHLGVDPVLRLIFSVALT